MKGNGDLLFPTKFNKQCHHQGTWKVNTLSPPQPSPPHSRCNVSIPDKHWGWTQKTCKEPSGLLQRMYLYFSYGSNVMWIEEGRLLSDGLYLLGRVMWVINGGRLSSGWSKLSPNLISRRPWGRWSTLLLNWIPSASFLRSEWGRDLTGRLRWCSKRIGEMINWLVELRDESEMVKWWKKL